MAGFRAQARLFLAPLGPIADFWSGTVTINPGDSKRPFGTFQYANFNVSDTYNFNYSVIAANGSIAYPNVKLGNSVVLLPGNYNLKAVQLL